jgi:cardiolipin synthase
VWRDDEVGQHFLTLLTEAAQRGVEVRLLVDEIGSRPTPRAIFSQLEQAGGRSSWATTLFPRRNRWFVNLRNHRKIVIVDGVTAFTGGMNIGVEYRDGLNGKIWNDLNLRVTGPAVTQLAAVFADDWHFASNERLRPVRTAEPVDDGMPAQLVAGGPDSPLATNARSVQALIASAQHRVTLTTPYFVPDAGLQAALELAAARGVRVRLLVSSETDMGPLLLLSRSYFETLMRVGVEIYEYDEDIHHAKLILVDDAVALVGSINLDIRSFHLNYEVALALYDAALVAELDDYLEQRLGTSTCLDPERFARRGMRTRLLEGALRLLAPAL